MRCYRSRNDPETATSPKPPQHGQQLTRAGNVEPTAQPAGSSAGWRVSFSASSGGLSLFQVAQRLSASSRQLVLSESVSQPSPQLIEAQGEVCRVNLDSFRDFLKLSRIPDLH